MSGLFPALIAALLFHLTDRPPMLAARLSERFGNVLAVLSGLALAYAIIAVLAAIFATAIRPGLPPDARTLMIGGASMIAGIIGLFPRRADDGLEAWRTGAFTTALLGGFNLAWGDRAYLIIFALAVAAPMPWAPTIGGWIGAIIAAYAAMAIGVAGWGRLPLRPLRIGIALLALAIGAALAGPILA